jgi:hypothetical protein
MHAAKAYSFSIAGDLASKFSEKELGILTPD